MTKIIAYYCLWKKFKKYKNATYVEYRTKSSPTWQFLLQVPQLLAATAADQLIQSDSLLLRTQTRELPGIRADLRPLILSQH